MLSKRIIPCLDVRAGKLTKGVKFQGNIDIGDPVEAARSYYEQGADEIVFYDITASAEERAIMIDVVRRVAETIFIPFSVGGGIRTLEDMREVILAGAEKVSVNTEAVKKPSIIAEGARAFGSQCIVLGMDPVRVANDPRFPSVRHALSIITKATIDSAEIINHVESVKVGEQGHAILVR